MPATEGAPLLPQDAALVLRAEEIEQGVTPGPWTIRESAWEATTALERRTVDGPDGFDRSMHVTLFDSESDAAFIAVSRSLLPELRDRVRVLSQQVAAVEAAPGWSDEEAFAAWKRDNVASHGVKAAFMAGANHARYRPPFQIHAVPDAAALGAALEVGESKTKEADHG